MNKLMDQQDPQRVNEQPDPTASERKKDHIELAFNSQVGLDRIDQRFYYEPMVTGHPKRGSLKSLHFLGKTFKAPLWVSSMTGGTEMARTINRNLARACKDFGMGMGLGSCRSLLYSDDTLSDFDVRDLIGDNQPLFANLGIAQVEELVSQGELYRIGEMLDKLRANGLIIHVNPLQEWLQPEGDFIHHSPLDTILRVLDKVDAPIIVKEVGQGFGKESLRALFRLPLAAIDFAANGGTNFAKLELLRSDPLRQEIYSRLAWIGHSADEMVEFTNELLGEMGDERKCNQVIISGGIKHFLDGYYLQQKIQLPAVYGQASSFLQHARGDYDTLHQYVESQIQGLELAQAFLRLR
jgi:isopentenyl-diphosphate delta-isomerase